jgi:hypothetical protein
LDDCIEQKPACGVMGLHLIPLAKLLKCLDRDIFKRLWCVQEILLAQCNDVRSSQCHVDIAVFARSTRLICVVLQDLDDRTNEVHRKAGTPFPGIRRLRTISDGISTMLIPAPLPCLDFKEQASPVTSVTAFTVVHENSVRECSNLRDHIYGLAALCSLGTSYGIDYSALSLTTPEVFTGFILHSLHTTGSLEALKTVYRKAVLREDNRTNASISMRHRCWTPGLPTWCVNEGYNPISRPSFRLRTGLLATGRAVRTSKLDHEPV